jgi:nucleoside-diphosphate-sugar epimerase
MTRVLLTGASGFIGRFALDHLVKRGVEVHAVSRTRITDAPHGVIWHEANLLDPTDVERVVQDARAEILLHLAWYAEPGLFWTSPLNLDWLAASIALARNFVSAGGRRVVVSGTCAEYDWQGGDCVEQTTPLAPATLYGVTKDAYRRVLEGFAAGGPFSLAWGRVFFLYGPREDARRLISSVTRGLLRGERTATTAGLQIRDLMHVDDVADALVSLGLSDVVGAVNIASGQPCRLRDAVEQIAEAVGRRDLLDLGGLPTRANEPQILTANVARLQTEVGFRPRWALSDGIRDTVEWWQSQLVGDAAAR